MLSGKAAGGPAWGQHMNAADAPNCPDSSSSAGAAPMVETACLEAETRHRVEGLMTGFGSRLRD